MPTLLSTVDHIGIRREHWDDTGDATADYYIDDYNNATADFMIPRLIIYQPLAITDSAAGANNGVASGSIYYNGDNTDLEWSTDNWATSNSTTGADSDQWVDFPLAPGTYTLKVRDSTDTDISAETTFIIKEKRAYAVKYRVEFDTITEGDAIKIEILQDAYAGSVVEVCGTGSPLSIEWGSSESEKFQVIKGSRAVINLLTDSTTQDFNEFFDSDDEEYYVKIYKNGSVHWRGFLNTDSYTEAYEPYPYPVGLVATDNIGQLKRMKFQSRTGARYNHPKVGLFSLLRYMYVDLFYSQTAKTSTHVPLFPDGLSIASTPTIAQVYVDCNSFYPSDGTIPTWHDVITAILKPLLCRFFFSEDYFWVQYIQDPKASVTYHYHSAIWSTNSRDFRVDTGCDEAVRPVNADHVQEMLPAYRDVSVKFTFDPDENLSPAPSFVASSFANPSVDGEDAILWNRSDASYFGSKEPAAPYITTYTYKINDTTSTGNSREYAKSFPVPVGVNATETGRMLINLKYIVQKNGTLGEHEMYLSVLSAGHYLSSDGSWTELTLDGGGGDTDVDDILIAVPYDQEDDDGFITYEYQLFTDEIPWSEQLNPTTQLRLYAHGKGTASVVSVYVDEISCVFLPDGIEAATTYEVEDENILIKESDFVLDLSHGYVDLTGSKEMVNAQFYDTDGELITLWEQTGETGSKDLMDICLARLNAEVSEYKKKISGSYLGPLSFVDMPRIGAKTFLQDTMKWDVKRDIRTLTALELDSSHAWPT